MKFNLNKFCSKNFDKNVNIKEEEIKNAINKQYDVGLLGSYKFVEWTEEEYYKGEFG